ncbi:MAG: T9SS type A sorting domain-containing protein [Chitinophagaceae bacterium]|nr:T9SS type A sorting domain-containing protein [Chitinophagaceae bacterium]
MKTKIIITLSILFCCYNGANAQFQGKVYEEDTSVSVFSGGVEKTLAWCGGLNNPQYSIADLNNDGLNDLVIFQADQSSVKTFINYGTSGAPKYLYRPRYAENFPYCSFYLIMRDYNGDGAMDLFESGRTGYTIHRGYYNAANELCFTFYKSLFYSNDKLTTGLVNAEANPGDIPAIVDVDGDGDLDFLGYYGDGFYMNWYQNLQVEDGLPKDSVRIRLADKCWGKMKQAYIRSHDLGVYCDNSSLLKTTGPISGSTLKTTDGGNTPCLLDIDGDNDYDVLDGHRAFNYLVYLRNGKSLGGGRDSMVYQDTAWTTLGDTVKIAQWAAAFHLDVDDDGKRDLLVAPNSPNTSENYKCSQFYKNIGTDKIPSFKFQSDTFLVSDAIDLGTNAYPFFYDYDRDGKPDLFVGNRGYYEASTGQFLTGIMYMRNTSTTGNPSFEVVTKDFLGLAALRLKGLSIGIGDIDNDGKDDLLMGHLNGKVSFIKNIAATAAAMPNWSNSPTLLKDATGIDVQTNGFAVPLVFDIDADGVKDLLIGDQMGSLFYYKNTSTTVGIHQLVYTNDKLGFVKSDPEKIASGHSTPFIGRMDNTSKEYLVMGSRSGRIFRYTGFEGGNVFSAYTRLDSAYSFIFSKNAEYTSYMSAPAIADIDGDGKYEMVVGNVYGGLLMYKQNKTISISEASIENETIKIFPNPANTKIIIDLKQTNTEKNTSITIYNSLGQVVKIAPIVHNQRFVTIDIQDLAAAIYYCKVQIGSHFYSSIFVKQNQ